MILTFFFNQIGGGQSLKLMYGCFLLNKFKSLEALHSLNQLTLLFEHICT